MEKTFINIQVPKELERQIRLRSAAFDISRSEAMRRGARLWLTQTQPICPVCNGDMHADVTQPGVWYCNDPGCDGRQFIDSNGKE